MVLNISKKGPHKGFSVQGNMINEVQKAIFESEMPMFLYMIDEAAANATKGSPIANHVVGIQEIGFRFLGGLFDTQ